MSSKIKSVVSIVTLLFILPNMISQNQAQQVFNNSIQAFYVFGDSYVDPGNNDYILSIAKSNSPPYGIDFLNQIATGRFSNGKLIADFFASFLGFQNYSYVPYLAPNFTIQSQRAVGFASAGSGFDNRTAAFLNVISMSAQLEYFKEYKARLASSIGQEGADNLTTNAVYFVNCAVNDFLISFYGPGHTLFSAGTTIGQYEDFVSQLLLEFIQGLVRLGARRIAVSGVPLFGCWPIVITQSSSNTTNALVTRACNDTLNAVGNDYNIKVQAALRTLRNSSANIELKLAYFDTYTPMLNIRRNPAAFGINVTNKGCCGTGLLEFGPFCNSLSALCANRSEYEFFDSAHPTETTASIIVDANVAAINSITS
ncbi:hypothetical protein RHMOL_Rhmol13G0242700 [Rhododendron molle]|uniref:Uncharacterized protein n=1 Tax=Rhododendron molle TaxID=49168 RepID=A0ACC0LA51_RHOML|nr:hypothetical protein RHMOL_Rhmol13G0242700 [Rhododendron molle]